MKVMPGSVGYDFWLSCDITLRTKTITRVAMRVKVIIPVGYIGVIHSKSGSGDGRDYCHDRCNR